MQKNLQASSLCVLLGWLLSRHQDKNSVQTILLCAFITIGMKHDLSNFIPKLRQMWDQNCRACYMAQLSVRENGRRVSAPLRLSD